jgi:hypothetical protein
VLERTSALPTNVPSEKFNAVRPGIAATQVAYESIHAVQQNAAIGSVTSTPRPEIVFDPELTRMSLSSNEKAMDMPSSLSTSFEDGVEELVGPFLGVSKTDVHSVVDTVQQNAAAIEVPSESVTAVQQNAATSYVANTPWPGIEANPELMVLSGKKEHIALSKTESKPVVDAVQQNAATSSVIDTPGPGVEADPELMGLSNKGEDNAFSKTDLKQTVVAVLGLTGAGKSTFIRNVTRSEDVVIGQGLSSGKHLQHSPQVYG